MKLEDRLQLLRKRNGYSQEQLSDKIGIARQTISKWENGQAIPELNGLILLSDLYGVSIDRIVKHEDQCNIPLCKNADLDMTSMISFLVRAKKSTYSAGKHKVVASRLGSSDYRYEEDPYRYEDIFLGSENFTGQEAIWQHGHPVWGMNYSGRVLNDSFLSSFLKEALLQVSSNFPYRGPRIFTKGEFSYHCNMTGEFSWFQGYEEIFYLDEKVYECYFHGGFIQ